MKVFTIFLADRLWAQLGLGAIGLGRNWAWAQLGLGATGPAPKDWRLTQNVFFDVKLRFRY